MGEVRTGVDVREISDLAAVIDVEGDVTAASEPALMSAYERAIMQGARRHVLNFGGLEYMNGGGIGMLVTLLIRANRQHKKPAAHGLRDHCREISSSPGWTRRSRSTTASKRAYRHDELRESP